MIIQKGTYISVRYRQFFGTLVSIQPFSLYACYLFVASFKMGAEENARKLYSSEQFLPQRV